VIERLTVGADNKKTISSNDVADVLTEIRRFEAPSQVPLGFREDDSLDEFLARTTLGVYNHLQAVTGNHSEVARILRIHRNTLYLRIERARRILRTG
jgi:transcriptional regulator with PAS, ATPase and Fis domain